MWVAMAAMAHFRTVLDSFGSSRLLRAMIPLEHFPKAYRALQATDESLVERIYHRDDREENICSNDLAIGGSDSWIIINRQYQISLSVRETRQIRI